MPKAEVMCLHLLYEHEGLRGDGMWDPPYVPLLPVGVQRVLFGAPAGMQLVLPLKRPFIPDAFGECLIVAAERPAAKKMLNTDEHRPRPPAAR